MIVSLRVIDLAATSEGYTFVRAEFHRTMSTYTSIIKIQRVQNPTLYREYAAKKERLDVVNPKGTQNERWLFHGTKESAIPLINKTNFNRSFRGQNGMGDVQQIPHSYNTTTIIKDMSIPCSCIYLHYTSIYYSYHVWPGVLLCS